MTSWSYFAICVAMVSINSCSDKVDERDTATLEISKNVIVEDKNVAKRSQDSEQRKMSMEIDESANKPSNESLENSTAQICNANTGIHAKTCLRKDSPIFDDENSRCAILKKYSKEERNAIETLTFMKSRNYDKKHVQAVKHYESEAGQQTDTTKEAVQNSTTVRITHFFRHKKQQKESMNLPTNPVSDYLSPNASSAIIPTGETTKQPNISSNMEVYSDCVISDTTKPNVKPLKEAYQASKKDYIRKPIIADDQSIQSIQKNSANRESSINAAISSKKTIQRVFFCTINPNKRKNNCSKIFSDSGSLNHDHNYATPLKIQKMTKESINATTAHLERKKLKIPMQKKSFPFKTNAKSQLEQQETNSQMPAEDKTPHDYLNVSVIHIIPDFHIFNFCEYYAEHEIDIIDRLNSRIIRTQGYSELGMPYEHGGDMQSVLMMLSTLMHTTLEIDIRAAVERHGYKNNIDVAIFKFTAPLTIPNVFYDIRHCLSCALSNSGLYKAPAYGAYITYTKTRLNGLHPIAKFICFANFIKTNFYCMQKSLDAYTIRPGLWAINLCMPEVSLYFGWRMSTIIEEIKNNIFINHDFCTEIDHLVSLLNQFSLNPPTEKSSDQLIGDCKAVVKQYRSFISQLLIKHYSNQLQNHLYSHGFIDIPDTSCKLYMYRNANIMNMLAFAIRPGTYGDLSIKNPNGEQKNIFNLSYNCLIRKKICNNNANCYQTIRVLQSLIRYFRKMKVTAKKRTNALNFIIPFQLTNLFIPYVGHNEPINIYIMANEQMFEYYYDRIMECIME